MGLKEELLRHYRLSEADYASLCLPPDIRNIPFIDGDASVVAAVKRIQEALERQEKIIVYGDYDCDGIMATSIMVYAFGKLGKKVASYIPSRYLDGYGLTLGNAEKIAKAGYKLVILVDNGVSCEKEVSYLFSQGVDTIIIDHHELPPSLPPSLALIHPDTLRYGSDPVSAGYLSFLFSSALTQEVDPYLLILGALSTISDMMPLHSYNREIVRLALRYLNQGDYPTVLGLTKRRYIDEDVLSMEIIPKINAVGRLVEDHSVNRTVSYFAYPSSPERLALGEWMETKNAERKALSSAAMEEVDLDDNAPGIVSLGNLKEGLNGLLANRLLQSQSKPVAVLSPSQSDASCYVGSIRSKGGFLFPEFASYAKDLLVRYGGHGLAGGFSIKKEDFPAFKEAFLTFASSHPMSETKEDEIPIGLSDISPESYRLIASFGPFGQDHKKPLFVVNNVLTESLAYSRDENHISTALGKETKLLGFFMKKSDLSQYRSVTLHGYFALGEWKGKTNIEFRLSGYEQE